VRAGSSDATVAAPPSTFRKTTSALFAQPQELLAIILLLYYAGVALPSLHENLRCKNNLSMHFILANGKKSFFLGVSFIF
jgi:hypothetical protein